MRPYIWITRTALAAENSAQKWQAKGFDTITAPLLEVKLAAQRPAEPKAETVLIFTSKNAIWAFHAYGFAPVQEVITVGDASAHYARTIGFKHVHSAKGTSADVTRLVQDSINMDRPILHCSGDRPRGTIIEDLGQMGYQARKMLYYCTQPVPDWPDIDYQRLSHIAFYSPRAAQHFHDLCQNRATKTLPRHASSISLLIQGDSGGQADKGSVNVPIRPLISQPRFIFGGICFVSISGVTDQALQGLEQDFEDARRLIAHYPNEQSMLALF